MELCAVRGVLGAREEQLRSTNAQTQTAVATAHCLGLEMRLDKKGRQ
jgi:hypothetical protein